MSPPSSPAAGGAGAARPRIVIIGAGFAGLATARGLRNAHADVTIIDRTNHHLFQPLLYQVATAELAPGDIAQPIRHILRRQPNVTVTLGEVSGIDTAARQVLLNGRTVPYDILVVATGSRHSYFGRNEWEEHAPGLKTIEDARHIRARVLAAFEQAEICANESERARLLRFVVIGGGPTGVEVAGAIAELARHTLAREFRAINPAMAQIILVEAGNRILGQFPEALSVYALDALHRLGVTVRTGAKVTSITAEGVELGSEFLPAATVVWGAGVMATPVGRWLDVETDRFGRVPVGPDFSVPSLPDVYVIGDVALALHTDGTPLPGLAQVADQEGKWLGRMLAARINGEALPEPFEYANKGNLATIGRNAAVADFGRFKLKGFIAWLVWGIVHVYLLHGFENRFIVTFRWLWAYVTRRRGARLVTYTPLPYRTDAARAETRETAEMQPSRAGRPV